MIPNEIDNLFPINKSKEIQGLDQEAMKKARYHWDHIAKPIDGLGKLEKLLIQIAGIQQNANIDISRKIVIPMCADNGVVAEGVSQSGMEVTAIVAANMAKGISSVCKMAQVAGAEVHPVDIGIACEIHKPNLYSAKVRHGTRDFLIEPAMTREEVLQAIQVGIEQVAYYKKHGINMIATGEMGIGNTTTSSAMASILLNLPVERVTGRGAGLDDTGLVRKQVVIKQAIEQYKLPRENTFEILQTFGGLDIAGLVGLYIGGAIYRVPIVIDGMIAAVAALAAARLVPVTQEFMLPSHKSKEPATEAIMKELEMEPIIDGNLALGEGTGAVMLFPMLDMASRIYQDNTTFADIAIADYERF